MDRSKWEYKKLGDICKSINAGGTPSRGNSAYWNGNIPLVKIKDTSLILENVYMKMFND